LGTTFFCPRSSKHGKGIEETLLSEEAAVANYFRERHTCEVRRIYIPRTGVKIALAAAYFHGFGVARLGPWVTSVNKPQPMCLIAPGGIILMVSAR
jgi:hypothetical protein